jgi:hypothetical protein
VSRAVYARARVEYRGGAGVCRADEGGLEKQENARVLELLDYSWEEAGVIWLVEELGVVVRCVLRELESCCVWEICIRFARTREDTSASAYMEDVSDLLRKR